MSVMYAANVAMTIGGAWLALEFNNPQAYVIGLVLILVGLSKNRG